MKPTRDEILNEPAGPRLNQWIAIHVMEWHPSGVARDMNGIPFPEPMPDYSGEIAAAWEVVEKWRDPDKPGGYGEVMLRSEGPPDTGLWVVEFGTEGIASARDLPEAICKAALLAVVG